MSDGNNAGVEQAKTERAMWRWGTLCLALVCATVGGLVWDNGHRAGPRSVPDDSVKTCAEACARTFQAVRRVTYVACECSPWGGSPNPNEVLP